MTIEKTWKTAEDEAAAIAEAAEALESPDADDAGLNSAKNVQWSLSEDDLAQIVGGLAFGAAPDDDLDAVRL